MEACVKILDFFERKKEKKRFRNSYYYFEAKSKAWIERTRKRLSSALASREGCISKGAATTISQAEREGKLGQSHCAVNNDISEGMGGYRNFGSPLDCRNDRTRRWTPLSLSLSPSPFYLPFRSLLAFTYQSVIDLNLPGLFNEVRIFLLPREK